MHNLHLLADDSIDLEIFELLEGKRTIVDAVTDGEEFTGDPKIVKAIVGRILNDAREGQQRLV